jgi:hypothetical protein
MVSSAVKKLFFAESAPDARLFCWKKQIRCKRKHEVMPQLQFALTMATGT